MCATELEDAALGSSFRTRLFVAPFDCNLDLRGVVAEDYDHRIESGSRREIENALEHRPSIDVREHLAAAETSSTAGRED